MLNRRKNNDRNNITISIMHCICIPMYAVCMGVFILYVNLKITWLMSNTYKEPESIELNICTYVAYLYALYELSTSNF